MSDDLMIGIEPVACSMLTLRGDLSSPAFVDALAAQGLSVPGPLSLAGQPGDATLWFSPDELLSVLPAGRAGAVATALAEALGVEHAMALDISGARGVFRLTGARVGEVLAKGAPCDCSDRGFAPGTVRRTHLAGLAVAIWRFDDETWEIGCFRSYAHHLEAWLREVSVPAAAVY